MATQINQKEYLKRYLSGNKSKKKIKKPKLGTSTVKIIDDDIDLSQMQKVNDSEYELIVLGEEAPQIAGIVDERPLDVQLKEKFNFNKRWKIIGHDDGFNSTLTVEEQNADTNRVNDAPSPKSDHDYSPPRRGRRNSNSDHSPPRKRTEKSDSDCSPPRVKVKREKTDSDNSPPRIKQEVDSDCSPPRTKHRSDSDNDIPRKKHRSKDSSPPRRKHSNPSPKHPNSKHSHEPPKMRKTLDGRKAGLLNSKELMRETRDAKKREDEMFKKMSLDVSGKNAATVMRDRRTGKVRDLNEEAAQLKAKTEKENAQKEKYMMWGRGLKQVEDTYEKLKSDMHEMNKPLARYADDEDLEKFLKEQERDGDPMLLYLRKEKRTEERKQGKVNKPMYQGGFMPNRFGIVPGHRWDGVDRSNGYEKTWIQTQNSKKASLEDAYKWSTEDM